MQQDIFYAAVLVLLIGLFIARGGKKINITTITYAMVWIIIIMIIIILYAFRFELSSARDRVVSVLIPSYSWAEKGALKIARNYDNHFYVKTLINGQEIRFLIDTGATEISLTQADAKKLGIEVEKLNYNRKSSTANGISYSARVVLDEFKIAGKAFYQVDAYVSPGNNDISLCGMSLISRFSSFKIDKDILILEY